MFSKFFICSRNFSYRSIYLNIDNELRKKFKAVLRKNVRKMCWLSQPYRNFDYNRKAIYKTDKTIAYIYNFPNYSIRIMTANILLLKHVMQNVWQIYATYPFRICGSFLGSYCVLSSVFKDS